MYGGFSPVGSSHHPLTAFAAGGVETEQLWMFRADGTGHVWWVLNEAGGQAEEDDLNSVGARFTVGLLSMTFRQRR